MNAAAFLSREISARSTGLPFPKPRSAVTSLRDSRASWSALSPGGRLSPDSKPDNAARVLHMWGPKRPSKEHRTSDSRRSKVHGTRRSSSPPGRREPTTITRRLRITGGPSSPCGATILAVKTAPGSACCGRDPAMRSSGARRRTPVSVGHRPRRDALRPLLGGQGRHRDHAGEPRQPGLTTMGVP